ncbi:hypothetical protein PFISCL1PPCAC_22541, partial [Pristionchus fissidentatus]
KRPPHIGASSRNDFERAKMAKQLDTITDNLRLFLESQSDEKKKDPLYLGLVACVEVLAHTREQCLSVTIEDVIEKEKRERSLVIECLPESDKLFASERVDDDFKTVELFLNAAEIEVRPETVFRMGQVSTRPRLLKVILPRKSAQQSLLRRLSKITELPGYKNVKVRPSLSESERKAQYDLRQKKKALNEAGGDYVIYAGVLMKKSEVESFKKSNNRSLTKTKSIVPKELISSSGCAVTGISNITNLLATQ